MLIAVLLFIVGFLSSFLQVSISGVVLLAQANIETRSTWLVVNAVYTGAGTLSQAKIYRPECSARVALNSERSHCTFASQYLASQHLYGLERIDVSSTSKWNILSRIVRELQRLSETFRNWKRLPCTCVVLALLEIHLNSVNSHRVVAFSRSKVSMRISVEQYQSRRIGFHNHFVYAKNVLSRFKVSSGIWCGLSLKRGTGNRGMGMGNGNGEWGTGNGESLKWGIFKSGNL